MSCIRRAATASDGWKLASPPAAAFGPGQERPAAKIRMQQQQLACNSCRIREQA